MTNSADNEKNKLPERRAKDFDLNFPENQYLKPKEQQRIQNTIKNGGIVVGTKTYISENGLKYLFNTDTKGVQKVLNDAPNDDIYTLDDVDYLSTPHIQKEIANRKEQPRSSLEMEKLNYASECVEAFSSNDELNKERIIQSDRIAKQRLYIGKKIIRERNATKSEISGLPLDGKGEVHHLKRVADTPEEALNPENMVVITQKEHRQFHSSNFLQDEKGFEEYKKSLNKNSKNNG